MLRTVAVIKERRIRDHNQDNSSTNYGYIHSGVN